MKIRSGRNGFRAGKLGIGMLLILGGAVGIWGARRLIRMRAAASADKEGQGGGFDASPLAQRWHSLDHERRHGHVPRDLSRESKDMDQRYHPDPDPRLEQRFRPDPWLDEATYLE